MSDEPWPYEYGTDLYWLWSWGYRIEQWLDSDEVDFTEVDWLPDRLAEVAMMNFDKEHPGVVRTVQEHLAFTKERCQDFLNDPQERDVFLGVASDLQDRIYRAAEIIAKDGAPQVDEAEYSEEDRRTGDWREIFAVTNGGIPLTRTTWSNRISGKKGDRIRVIQNRPQYYKVHTNDIPKGLKSKPLRDDFLNKKTDEKKANNT
jgi:hypothetical protein